jgi:hypothetical protein
MTPALRVLVLVVAGLAAGLAHADSPKGKAARALKTLSLRPMDAGAACTLEYRSTPFWLRPGTGVVNTVFDGWFGSDSGVTPDALRLGISTVYLESEKNTFTIIALDFMTEEAAVRAEQKLTERHGKTTAHRFARRGPYVLILAQPPPVNEECGKWMWEELGSRLGAVS